MENHTRKIKIVTIQGMKHTTVRNILVYNKASQQRQKNKDYIMDREFVHSMNVIFHTIIVKL